MLLSTPKLGATGGGRTRGQTKLLRLFLVVSRLDAVDDHGLMALHHAAIECQLSTVKLLLVPGPGSELSSWFSWSEILRDNHIVETHQILPPM